MITREVAGIRIFYCISNQSGREIIYLQVTSIATSLIRNLEDVGISSGNRYDKPQEMKTFFNNLVNVFEQEKRRTQHSLELNRIAIQNLEQIKTLRAEMNAALKRIRVPLPSYCTVGRNPYVDI